MEYRIGVAVGAVFMLMLGFIYIFIGVFPIWMFISIVLNDKLSQSKRCILASIIVAAIFVYLRLHQPIGLLICIGTSAIYGLFISMRTADKIMSAIVSIVFAIWFVMLLAM